MWLLFLFASRYDSFREQLAGSRRSSPSSESFHMGLTSLTAQTVDNDVALCWNSSILG